MSTTAPHNSNAPVNDGVERGVPSNTVSHHQIALGKIMNGENPRDLVNQLSALPPAAHENVPIDAHPAWLLSLSHRTNEALNLLSDELYLNCDSVDLKLLSAVCLLKTKSYKAAEGLLKEVLAVQPNHIEAKYYYAHVLMHLGEWETGLRLIEESRNSERLDLEAPFYKDPRRYWTGQDLKGKHIVILGNGRESEEILYSRYVEKLRELNPRLIGMVCSSARLLRLMRNLKAINRVDLALFEPFDYYIPIGMLPFMFRATESDVPVPPSLLDGSSGNIGMKMAKLPKGKPVLGLCWRQRSDKVKRAMGIHRNTFANSLELETLEKILSDLQPHYSFLSLQADATPFEKEKLRQYGMVFPDSPDFEKYSVVADWMACLDSVLTVDSPMAHLAGSYGIDCKVILPYSPHWMWGKHHSKTVWYSSVTLFRQRTENSWNCIIPAVLRDLKTQAFPERVAA